jgi:hypothetical protein
MSVDESQIDLTQLSDDDLRDALCYAARSFHEANDVTALAVMLTWTFRNAQPSLLRECAKWLQEADDLPTAESLREN